jgi:hypothetical protein
MIRLEGLGAFVKEVKVTNKGIILNLEKIKLNGTTMDELSALVQTDVHLTLQAVEPEKPEEKEPEATQMEMNFDPEKSAEEALAEQGFEVVSK